MKSNVGIFSSPILGIISTLSLVTILLVFSSVISVPSVEGKYFFFKKWGTLGSGNGEFKSPEGIAVDSSGRAYVVDTGNNRIQLFRLANPCPTATTQIVPGVCFVRAWGTFGTGNAQFNKPVDIAIDSSGLVYVADAGNNRIQLFRGNGAFMKAWSSDGPGTAQFEKIVGVALDAATNEIYVAEGTVPGHIHKFRITNPCPTGSTEVVSGICFTAKWTFGVVPSHPPDPFERLAGVAVNSTTHEVYISDSIHVEHPMSEPDKYSVIKNTGNGIILGRWGGDVSSLLDSSIIQLELLWTHQDVCMLLTLLIIEFKRLRFKSLMYPFPVQSIRHKLFLEYALLQSGEHLGLETDSSIFHGMLPLTLRDLCMLLTLGTIGSKFFSGEQMLEALVGPEGVFHLILVSNNVLYSSNSIQFIKFAR